MESTPSKIKVLHTQVTNTLLETDHFIFYQQLLEIQTILNSLSLETYLNYFYRSKPLSSPEQAIRAIVPLDSWRLDQYLIFYIKSLKSKSKQVHSRLAKFNSDLHTQLADIQNQLQSILDVYACPSRARLFCNADDTWIYHQYKDYIHLFYQPFDDYIQAAELTPSKCISTYKIRRGKPSFHKDIASLVWPEDTL